MSFGDNSSFTNNSAEYGGGVYVEVVNGDIGNFTGNSAHYYAGCLAAKESTMGMSNSDLMNNLAWYGGCLFVDPCNLTLAGSNTFSGHE